MHYRKKPVVIEAKQFATNNEAEMPQMDGLVRWINHGRDRVMAWHNGTDIFILTLEGQMRATVGDWIIKGVKGEFYPIKDDIFRLTYDKVDPSPGGTK